MTLDDMKSLKVGDKLIFKDSCGHPEPGTVTKVMVGEIRVQWKWSGWSNCPFDPKVADLIRRV